MRVLDVVPLPISAVKVVRFSRFRDLRGYFTETYRASDLASRPDLPMLRDASLVQLNESYSKAGVVRGLHFQWNPHMGKLVRTVAGHMVDLFLDIRKGSPSFGKIAAYDMKADLETDYAEWIWIPPGFAHGNFFPESSVIEYGCTGEYSGGFEACISPLAPDLDWSLCEPRLRTQWDRLLQQPNLTLTEKDKAGLTLAEWQSDPRSENFLYSSLGGS